MNFPPMIKTYSRRRPLAFYKSNAKIVPSFPDNASNVRESMLNDKTLVVDDFNDTFERLAKDVRGRSPDKDESYDDEFFKKPKQVLLNRRKKNDEFANFERTSMKRKKDSDDSSDSADENEEGVEKIGKSTKRVTFDVPSMEVNDARSPGKQQNNDSLIEKSWVEDFDKSNGNLDPNILRRHTDLSTSTPRDGRIKSLLNMHHLSPIALDKENRLDSNENARLMLNANSGQQVKEKLSFKESKSELVPILEECDSSNSDYKIIKKGAITKDTPPNSDLTTLASEDKTLENVALNIVSSHTNEIQCETSQSLFERESESSSKNWETVDEQVEITSPESPLMFDDTTNQNTEDSVIKDKEDDLLADCYKNVSRVFASGDSQIKSAHSTSQEKDLAADASSYQPDEWTNEYDSSYEYFSEKTEEESIEHKSEKSSIDDNTRGTVEEVVIATIDPLQDKVSESNNSSQNPSPDPEDPLEIKEHEKVESFTAQNSSNTELIPAGMIAAQKDNSSQSINPSFANEIIQDSANLTQCSSLQEHISDVDIATNSTGLTQCNLLQEHTSDEIIATSRSDSSTNLEPESVENHTSTNDNNLTVIEEMSIDDSVDCSADNSMEIEDKTQSKAGDEILSQVEGSENDILFESGKSLANSFDQEVDNFSENNSVYETNLLHLASDLPISNNLNEVTLDQNIDAIFEEKNLKTKNDNIESDTKNDPDKNSLSLAEEPEFIGFNSMRKASSEMQLNNQGSAFETSSQPNESKKRKRSSENLESCVDLAENNFADMYQETRNIFDAAESVAAITKLDSFSPKNADMKDEKILKKKKMNEKNIENLSTVAECTNISDNVQDDVNKKVEDDFTAREIMEVNLSKQRKNVKVLNKQELIVHNSAVYSPVRNKTPLPLYQHSFRSAMNKSDEIDDNLDYNEICLVDSISIEDEDNAVLEKKDVQLMKKIVLDKELIVKVIKLDLTTIKQNKYNASHSHVNGEKNSSFSDGNVSKSFSTSEPVNDPDLQPKVVLSPINYDPLLEDSSVVSFQKKSNAQKKKKMTKTKKVVTIERSLSESDISKSFDGRDLRVILSKCDIMKPKAKKIFPRKKPKALMDISESLEKELGIFGEENESVKSRDKSLLKTENDNHHNSMVEHNSSADSTLSQGNHPIFLKPGKSWARSLSIINHFYSGQNLDDLAVGRGKNWRSSVQEVLNMQQEGTTQKPREENHSDAFASSQEDLYKGSKSNVLSSPPRLTKRHSIRIIPSDDRVTKTGDFLNTESNNNVTFKRKTSAARKTSMKIRRDTLIETEEDLINSAKEIILKRCGQTEYLAFKSCFPDPYIKKCRKIGEGVYGEVFLHEDGSEKSVIKIIPIEGDELVNSEPQKKFHEILSEIIISEELHKLKFGNNNRTDGFVSINKIKCIKGKYPQNLIKLWKAFDEQKPSENDCPTMFKNDQLYIVLELAHGGEELQAYPFDNAKESWSIFLQTAYSLAVAEKSLQFEHRDLHWGNLLVSKSQEDTAVFKLENDTFTIPINGVKVSVIDFTLSRMSYQGCKIFNDLAADPTLFTAEGDYQFDIYRLMRDKVDNDWQVFNPYTNILWLDYLLDKMIKSIKYKRKTTKIHKNTLSEMKRLKKQLLLNYSSAFDLVSNCKMITARAD